MADGYDVVEVTDWQLLFLPWVGMGSRAVVNVSLHGSCGQLASYDPTPETTSDADFVRLLEAQGLAAADHIQANSHANAREWTERTGREVQVIPPMIGIGESSTAPHANSSTGGLVVGRLHVRLQPLACMLHTVVVIVVVSSGSKLNFLNYNCHLFLFRLVCLFLRFILKFPEVDDPANWWVGSWGDFNQVQSFFSRRADGVPHVHYSELFTLVTDYANLRNSNSFIDARDG